jgi:hypothetical protein
LIDVENYIFEQIKGTVGSEAKGFSTTNSETPPEFPFLCVEQKDNPEYTLANDSSGEENAIKPLFEITCYTKDTGKKTQAKKIMSIVAQEMKENGFTRIFGPQEIENISNPTIFRMVARYQAVVDKNNKIYSI